MRKGLYLSWGRIKSPKGITFLIWNAKQRKMSIWLSVLAKEEVCKTLKCFFQTSPDLKKSSATQLNFFLFFCFLSIALKSSYLITSIWVYFCQVWTMGALWRLQSQFLRKLIMWKCTFPSLEPFILDTFFRVLYLNVRYILSIECNFCSCRTFQCSFLFSSSSKTWRVVNVK